MIDNDPLRIDLFVVVLRLWWLRAAARRRGENGTVVEKPVNPPSMDGGLRVECVAGKS